MANVRFVSTTQNRQNNREEYDNNALYFCTDSGALYRGAQLLSDGVRTVSSYSNLPEFNVAADGIIYYTEDTKNGYLLNKNRDGWISIIDSNSEETKQELKDYIDEKIGSIGGGFVQPNYEQNDSSQPDYIKNRTHYKEVIHQEKVELLPTTEIDFLSLGEMGYIQSEPLNIQAGDAVKVLWDNQEYECVAQSMATVASGGDMPLPSDGVIFGNLYNTFGVDPDSQDIPFVVVANYAPSREEEGAIIPGCWIMPMIELTDPIITVNIFTGGDKTIYHKLDLNYLPLSGNNISKDDDAIITSKPLLNYLRTNQSDWDINDSDDPRYIQNRPFSRYLTNTTGIVFDASIILDENGAYTSTEKLYNFNDIWDNSDQDINLTVHWHDGTYNCKLRQLYAQWTNEWGESQGCNYFVFGNVSDINGSDDAAPFLIYTNFNPETHKTGETYIKAYDGFTGEIALRVDVDYQRWNYSELDDRYISTRALQADWMEEDASKLSFVDNRPFYKYRISGNNHDSVTVLFELSNEGTCATPVNYLDVPNYTNTHELITGYITIQVKWNNQEYHCRIRYLTDEWIGDNGDSHARDYYVFGNVSSIDSNYPDTAPFLIYADYNPQTHEPGETYVVSQDGLTGEVSCVFRYSYDYWAYIKLDNKYLYLSSDVYRGNNDAVTGDAVYRAIHDAIGTALGGSY